MIEDDWEEMIECDLCNLPNDVSCVYFLFNDIELVYIGQTAKLKDRVDSHIRDKFWQYNYEIKKWEKEEEFNKVFYLPTSCNIKERWRLEQDYIENYEPKLNGFDIQNDPVAIYVHIERLKAFAREKGYTEEYIDKVFA